MFIFSSLGKSDLPKNANHLNFFHETGVYYKTLDILEALTLFGRIFSVLAILNENIELPGALALKIGECKLT